MITIKTGKSFTTSCGSVFTDRAVALAHEKMLARTDRLKAVEFNGFVLDGLGHGIVYESEMADFIADNAEAILEALTVRESRGRPSKAKSAPVFG